MRPLLVAIFTLALLGGQAAHALRVYVSVPANTAQSDSVIAKLREAGLLVEAGVHSFDASNELTFLRDVVAANNLEGTVLVATPVHRTDSTTNFQPILAANIPVFWLSSSIASIRGIAKVSASNFKAGKLLGEMYCDLQGQDKSRHVFLTTPDDACTQRRAGFLSALQANCPARAAEIEYERDVVTFTAGKPFSPTLKQDGAKDIMQELFLVDEAVDSVFGCHDDLVVGAVHAADAMREDGSAGVLFGGIGNTDQARPFVMAQVMYATVELNTGQIAEQMLKVLVMYNEKGVVAGNKYEVVSDSKLILGDPEEAVKKRIFAHYDKNAVPFIHWTYEENMKAKADADDSAAANAKKKAGPKGPEKNVSASLLEVGQHYGGAAAVSRHGVHGGGVSEGGAGRVGLAEAEEASASVKAGHEASQDSEEHTTEYYATVGEHLRLSEVDMMKRHDARTAYNAEVKAWQSGRGKGNVQRGTAVVRRSAFNWGPGGDTAPAELAGRPKKEGGDGNETFVQAATTSSSSWMELELKEKSKEGLRAPSEVGDTGRVSTISVKMIIKLMQLNDVEIMEDQFKATFYWKFRWVDERLYFTADEITGAFPYRYLIVDPQDVWQPDWCTLDGTFKKILDNQRISPHGKMSYGILTQVTALADFDLRMFPFDRQTLPVEIESMSYAKDMYEWVLPDKMKMDVSQLSGVWKFRKPYYAFRKVTVTVPMDPDPVEYETVQIFLFIERDPQTYWINYILPLNMINLVTYAAMYLDPTGDDSLDIVATTMLSVMSYMYVLYGEVPKTPYSTWMGLFVMFSVMLVLFATIQVTLIKAMCDNHATVRAQCEADGKELEVDDYDKETMADQRWTEDVPPRARRLIRIARTLYIACFLGLNCGMFTWVIMVGARRDYRDSQIQPPAH